MTELSRFTARFMRAARISLRRTDIFVRMAPGLVFRVVRNCRVFAHIAASRFARVAPQAANVLHRRHPHRRKYLKSYMPRAHYGEPVVRSLVGKRFDAHSEGPVVRIPST
ncbi:MAG: hypothetical protein C0483_11015 [Pirellula sp.]|nr:hypothetical protein [Pirellula sp.]